MFLAITYFLKSSHERCINKRFRKISGAEYVCFILREQPLKICMITKIYKSTQCHKTKKTKHIFGYFLSTHVKDEMSPSCLQINNPLIPWLQEKTQTSDFSSSGSSGSSRRCLWVRGVRG